jgi:hypothetical protein
VEDGVGGRGDLMTAPGTGVAFALSALVKAVCLAAHTFATIREALLEKVIQARTIRWEVGVKVLKRVFHFVSISSVLSLA